MSSSKLYSYILNKGLTCWIKNNNLLNESQAGFRKMYSTIDHLFTLMSLIQKQLLHRKIFYVAFIDFRKAFDSVIRSKLWAVLKKKRSERKMYKAVASKYNVVKSKVRAGNDLTESFLCPRGLKQEEICSPVLFSLFIDELANEIMPVSYTHLRAHET